MSAKRVLDYADDEEISEKGKYQRIDKVDDDDDDDDDDGDEHTDDEAVPVNDEEEEEDEEDNDDDEDNGDDNEDDDEEDDSEVVDVTEQYIRHLQGARAEIFEIDDDDEDENEDDDDEDVDDDDDLDEDDDEDDFLDEKAYVVVHDRVPVNGTHERQDTHIVGVFKTLVCANMASREYIRSFFEEDLPRGDADEDIHDYMAEPYYRENDEDDEPDDTVYVKQHMLI